MKSLFLVFGVAAVVAAVSCLGVLKLALRHGVVSLPGGRNVHTKAVPRVGGISIYLGMVAAIAVLLPLDAAWSQILRDERHVLLGLAAGGTLVFLLGLADDLRGLRAWTKLLVQVGVAAGTYAFGFRVPVLAVPLYGGLHLGALSLPVTMLWIVGIMNAINLIDGLDGLAGGVVFFACVTNLAVALITGSYFTAILMTAMVGALLGFLYHNFNPARIFMGDSGSYLLGYAFSVTVLTGSTQKASAAVSLVVPCLALGVPIFDTMLSIVRRAVARRPLFAPDRGHIHHRLLDLGLTQRSAVLLLYGVSLVFCATAVAVTIGRTWQVGGSLALAALMLVFFVRFANVFNSGRSSLAPDAPARQSTGPVRDAFLRHHVALAAASSVGEVNSTLEDFAKSAELADIRVISADGAPPGPAEIGARRFEIGRETAIAALVFVPNGPLQPQDLVVLELVAGIVEERWLALGPRAKPAGQPRNSERPIAALRIEPPVASVPGKVMPR